MPDKKSETQQVIERVRNGESREASNLPWIVQGIVDYGNYLKNGVSKIVSTIDGWIDPHKKYKNDYKDGGNPDSVETILKSNTLKGIFGAPYQFLPTVDPRIVTSNNGSLTQQAGSYVYAGNAFQPGIGREYAEKIVSHWPLVFFTPCRQKFMDDAKKSERDSAIADVINGNDALTEWTKTYKGKYYSTEFAYDEYYNCVNEMIGALSYFMGMDTFVGDDKVPAEWQTEVNEAFKDYYAASKSVVFYVDGSSLTTVEDQFVNSTGSTSLESVLNQTGTDQANELIFLLGQEEAAKQLEQKRDEFAESAFSTLNSMYDISNGMLGDLSTNGINTILNGGKIIFPEIWKDSSYDRSYNITIKLRSPDHDKYSIFMNILVPYIHLLCLVLPQSMKANQDSNAYQTPFLVRVYSKGQFNVDMGMIESMNVSRGGECQWTDDGLPTAIDITLSIKDLYKNLYMTNWYGSLPTSQNAAVATNSAMMDYIANLAGLNIAQEEAGRITRMKLYLSGKSAARIPTTLFTYVEDKIANWWRRFHSDE